MQSDRADRPPDGAYRMGLIYLTGQMATATPPNATQAFPSAVHLAELRFVADAIAAGNPPSCYG